MEDFICILHCTFEDKCPVHLPGQNNFCLRQNIFVPDKKFCPKLKSTFLLVIWMENNFLAMEKNFSTAWSHFLSFSQANMNFLAWDKNFCPGQKCFVEDKNYFVWYKIYFVQDKKYFVRGDGQGIKIKKERNCLCFFLNWSRKKIQAHQRALFF